MTITSISTSSVMSPEDELGRLIDENSVSASAPSYDIGAMIDANSTVDKWATRAMGMNRVQKSMDAHAVERLNDAWLPSTKAAFLQLGTNTFGTAARGASLLKKVSESIPWYLKPLVGPGSSALELLPDSQKSEDFADNMTMFGEAFGKAAHGLEEKSGVGDLKGALRGAFSTVPLTVIGGVGSGPYGAIATGMLMEGSQAATEAKKAGMSDAGVATYAISQGAWEGAFASLMQKFGLGGFGKYFAKNPAAKVAMANGFKSAVGEFGKRMTEEVFEEVVTEVGHNAVRYLGGVDDNALTLETLASTVYDTTLQTIAGMGMTETVTKSAEGYNYKIYGEQRKQQLDAVKARRASSGLVTNEEVEKDASGIAQDIIDGNEFAATQAVVWSIENPGETPSRKQWQEFGFPQGQRISKDSKQILIGEMRAIMDERANAAAAESGVMPDSDVALSMARERFGEDVEFDPGESLTETKDLFEGKFDDAGASRIIRNLEAAKRNLDADGFKAFLIGVGFGPEIAGNSKKKALQLAINFVERITVVQQQADGIRGQITLDEASEQLRRKKLAEKPTWKMNRLEFTNYRDELIKLQESGKATEFDSKELDRLNGKDLGFTVPDDARAPARFLYAQHIKSALAQEQSKVPPDYQEREMRKGEPPLTGEHAMKTGEPPTADERDATRESWSSNDPSMSSEPHVEDTQESNKKIVAARDFYRKVVDLFGLTPMPNTKEKGTAGTYSPSAKLMSTRKENLTVIDLLAHEVAHHVDDETFRLENQGITSNNYADAQQTTPFPSTSQKSAIYKLFRRSISIAKEFAVADYFKEPNILKRSNSDFDATAAEGFAEFIRMFITHGDGVMHDRKLADKVRKYKALHNGNGPPKNAGGGITLEGLLPEMHAWFNGEFKTEFPELFDKIQQLHELAADFNAQGTVKRARAFMTENKALTDGVHIEAGTPAEKIKRELVRKWSDEAYDLAVKKQRLLEVNPKLFDHIASSYDVYNSGSKNSSMQAEMAASEGVHLIDPTGLFKWFGKDTGIMFAVGTTINAFQRISNERLGELTEKHMFDTPEKLEEAMAYVMARGMMTRATAEHARRGSDNTIEEFVRDEFNVGLPWKEILYIVNKYSGEEAIKMNRAYAIITTVNDDILKMMRLLGAISQESFDNIMKKHRGSYVPMLGPWIHDPLSLVPSGALRTGSFLKSRGETRTKDFAGHNMDRLSPYDATMMRLTSLYKIMHQRNMILTMALESEPKIWTKFRKLGIPLPPDLMGTSREGNTISLIERKDFDVSRVKLEEIARQLVKAEVITEDQAYWIILKGDVSRLKDSDPSLLSDGRIKNALKSIGVFVHHASGTAFGKHEVFGQWNGGMTPDQADAWIERKEKKGGISDEILDFASENGNGSTMENLKNNLVDGISDANRQKYIDMLQEKLDEVQDPDYMFEVFHRVYKEDASERIVPLRLFDEMYYFQIDHDVFELLQETGKKQDNIAINYVKAAGAILRWGVVTFDLRFAARNIPKDLQTMWMQSGKDVSFKSILSDPKAALKMWISYTNYKLRNEFGLHTEKIELFEAFDALVGNVNTRRAFAHSSEYLPKAFKGKFMNNAGFALGAFQKVVSVVSTITAGTDVGPRLAEFMNVFDEGGYKLESVGGKLQFVNKSTGVSENPPEALYFRAARAAAEVTTDFARHGTQSKSADNFFLFLNAQIQSRLQQVVTIKRALGKSGTKKQQEAARKRLAIGIAMYAATQMLYLAIRGDDDDYLESPEHEWTNSWTFNFFGYHFQVPKGYDYAFIPNAFEAMFRAMNVEQRSSFKEMLSKEVFDLDPTGVVGNYGKTGKAIPDIPGVTPFVEAAFNFDLFKNREIETKWEQKLPVWQRGAENASPVANMLASIMPEAIGMSPKKIDFLFENIFGSMPASLLTRGDFTRASGVTAFVARHDYSSSVTEMYESFADREMKMNSLKQGGDNSYVEFYGDYISGTKYKELMSDMRKFKYSQDDDEMSDKIDKWFVSLAREALGKSRLDTYGNFWKDELPPELASIRNEYRRYYQGAASAKPPTKRAWRDSNYQETMGKWKSKRGMASKWLAGR